MVCCKLQFYLVLREQEGGSHDSCIITERKKKITTNGENVQLSPLFANKLYVQGQLIHEDHKLDEEIRRSIYSDRKCSTEIHTVCHLTQEYSVEDLRT